VLFVPPERGSGHIFFGASAPVYRPLGFCHRLLVAAWP
jgi:hypothetical protein